MSQQIKNKELVVVSLALFLAAGAFLFWNHFLNQEDVFAAYTSTPSASTNLTCFVTDGACSGTVIFRMSDYLGEHSELSTQSNFSYKVCCTGTGISNSCSGSYDTVLKLSGVTNAHAEKNTLSNYSSDACLSSSTMGVTCNYSTTCGTEYACLASISSDTNAHVGECSTYATKVCCKVGNYTSTPSASTNLTCSVTDGDCDGTVIFRMHDYLGNHAQLYSETDYPYKVCCTGTGISNSCSGNYDTVLKLSSDTNAHAEENTLSNYSSNVCLSSSTPGAVACSYSTSCALLGADYVCLASISSDTNAHVGECSTYATKVCCEVPSVIVDACTSKVVSDNLISLKDTNIQLCSGADIADADDPCYSVCWKGTGTPVVTSSNWKCGVCHDINNAPVSCSTLGSTTFDWVMPTGYATPANYTLISGTLASANPIVRFVATDSNRQLTLNINNYGMTCAGQNSLVPSLPIWKEVSPF
ncbi:MAG: hypothetical protein PHD31_01265 [Candidatus Pacebacteria bacterium]|nr:hypothetical protein [Candidatus Paceibacterota bacterium]